MLKIAALALASAAGLTAAAASASSSDTLVAGSPWWEKVTVTMAGDKPESCRYESSLTPNKPESCDVSDDQASVAGHDSSKGDFTRITFERRFTPGVQPAAAKAELGDTLLGGQVMALAIDARGKVANCKIVSAAGDVRPAYGCDEASAERFNASVGGERTAAPAREGYMTILVYGHSEHMV